MGRLIYSVSINEARMNAVELEVGSNPIMRMYGLNQGDAVPATCEEAASGFVIAEGSEVAGNWLGAPSTTKVGSFVARANIFSSWVLALQAEGEIKYMRIYDSSGNFCGVQCEVKDISELPTLTGTQDPETGVWNGQHFEPGYFYVDGKVITQQQVTAGDVLTLSEFAFTAGNQARFADVP